MAQGIGYCRSSNKEYRFRTYLRPNGPGWYANCIDLCLDAEGDTLHETLQKLNDSVMGYLQTVRERDLGAAFLHRPSAWRHRLWYYSIKIAAWIKGV